MKALLPLALAAVLIGSVQAQVLSTNAVVDGRTISEWSAEWWKWVLTTPTNQNPLFDTDGSRATNAQPDAAVFFLAGIFLPGGSGAVTRHFTVREDKYLFFPVANIFGDNVDTIPPLTVPELRDALAAILDTATNLHASIDGVPVTNLFEHRAQSPVFSIDFSSADNLVSYNVGHPFSGLDDPILADGYYLMVAPLAPGVHVVNFGTTFPAPQVFTLDITDVITVTPVPASQRVRDLISSAEASSLPRNGKAPLFLPLRQAERSFERGRTTDGIFHLAAFQNKVRQQLTPTYPDLAKDFSRLAQNIIDAAVRATVLPNDAIVDGKTIGEWSAEWWQWQLPISTNQNPMLDTNGVFAPVGQPDDSVFLIGGGSTPDTFVRSFSVPETKYLFTSVLPRFADNAGKLTPNTVEELREQVRGVIDTATNLHASIDGVEVTNVLEHRAISPVFSIFYANADNLHTWWFGHPITDLIEPMVSDGYWLMLEPLAPGPHVLRINGSSTNGFSFGTHLLDYINVTPVSLLGWMSELIASVEKSSLSTKAQRPLLQKLRQAEKWFERNHHRAGMASLRAFEHQVRTRVARTNPAEAEDFIRRAGRTLARATRDFE